MSGKELKFGQECRNLMLSGINELENAVVTTLGPKGRMVLLDSGKMHPVITKDGVSVARSISFSNHYKNVGVSLVKEAAEKTNTVAGDGTTTTVYLTSELAKEGTRLVASGFDPVEIQRGMDTAGEDIIAALDSYKKVVSSEDDIYNIAALSANNDPEVGKIVSSAFSGIGEGGIVNVFDSHSKSGKTTIKFASGIEFPKGISSGHFINNPQTEQFIVDNPYILLCDFKPTLEQLLPVMNFTYKKSKPLVVIGAEVDDDVEGAMISQMAAKRYTCAFIKAPGFSMFSMSDQLKDLAAVLGCKVIGSEDDLKQFINALETTPAFGTCLSIASSIDKTVIESKGNEDLIATRVEELKAALADGQKDEDRGMSEEETNIYKRRIASLTGGIATIQVGGLTDARIVELKDRYEDAVHAVQAAITDGIVPGCGIALLKASASLQNKKISGHSSSWIAGYKAVLTTCKMPITKIISSVSSDYAYIVSKIEHSKNEAYGYNAKEGCITEDVFKDGIIDPIKVEKAAVTYAVATAGIFITTECVVTDDNPNISLTPNDPIAERSFSFDGEM